MFPTFNLSCERTELDLVQNGGNLDQNEIQYDSFSRFYLHVLVVMSKMSTDIIPWFNTFASISFFLVFQNTFSVFQNTLNPQVRTQGNHGYPRQNPGSLRWPVGTTPPKKRHDRDRHPQIRSKNGSLSGTTTRPEKWSSRSIFLRKLLTHSSVHVCMILTSLKLMYTDHEFTSSPPRAFLTESTTKLVL